MNVQSSMKPSLRARLSSPWFILVELSTFTLVLKRYQFPNFRILTLFLPILLIEVRGQIPFGEERVGEGFERFHHW